MLSLKDKIVFVTGASAGIVIMPTAQASTTLVPRT
jgi:NADP-dependent 3-hydroxy acid dehydrogenase YdfG